MRRKRFLLDVDEVLADFQNPTFEIIRRLFGREVTHQDFEVWDCFSLLTPEEKQAVFAEIEKPGWCASLQPKPGAQEAVKALREHVQVFAVTSHFPSSPTWVHERDHWLIKHFGFSGKEIVHTSAKYLVAGDYLLDDNPGHVASWADEHPDGQGLLWHIPNTRKLGLDEVRMHTWDQVLDRVTGTLDNETVYDLLDEREWSRAGDPYPAGNYCQTCGASAKGSKLPEHESDCRLHNILTWHRERSG